MGWVGFILLLFLAMPAAGRAFTLEPVDHATIDTLLRKGPLLSLEQDEFGNITWTLAGTIIHAPPEAIWEVLNNLDDYEKFAPHTEEVRVLKKDGNKSIVNFRMKIKFSVLSVGVDTTDEVILDRDKWSLDWTYLRGDFAGSRGGWNLVPLSDSVSGAGTQKHTAAFYRFHADLRTLGFGVRLLLRTHPEVEMGVLTAMAVRFVQALKDRVEHPERYVPEGAQAFQ
ncbi:MAG: hypothetical protein HYT87_14130 [Nitrospirae bacterium]|nr:hypothetical protein [Nitrospirota bacterium]